MTTIQKELSITKVATFAKTMFPFAVLFGLVKGATLLGGIWMAQLIGSMQEYGVFEYAFTAGILLSIPLNVGMQGAYPHFILEKKRTDFGVIFYAHAFVLLSGILGLLLGSYCLGYWPVMTINFSLIIGGIIALQVLTSVICKSQAWIYKAVVLEGGLFLVINAYNLWIYWSQTTYQLAVLQNNCLVYLLGFWLWYGYQLYQYRKAFLWTNYRTVFHFGQSIVLSSILFIALTSGGKLLIGHFLGMEAVGYYAYYLRFASILFLVYQAFNIFFFKTIYQAKTKELDSYYAIYLCFLSLLGIVLGIVLPIAFPQLILPFKDANQYLPLFYLLLCQVIFWIYTALNEMLIYRENLAVQMNQRIALLLGSSIWAVYLVHQLHILNLILFILLNISSLFIATEIQSALLLQQKQIDLSRTRRVSRVLFLMVVAGVAIYSR